MGGVGNFHYRTESGIKMLQQKYVDKLFTLNDTYQRLSPGHILRSPFTICTRGIRNFIQVL